MCVLTPTYAPASTQHGHMTAYMLSDVCSSPCLGRWQVLCVLRTQKHTEAQMQQTHACMDSVWPPSSMEVCVSGTHTGSTRSSFCTSILARVVGWCALIGLYTLVHTAQRCVRPTGHAAHGYRRLTGVQGLHTSLPCTHTRICTCLKSAPAQTKDPSPHRLSCPPWLPLSQVFLKCLS